MHALQPQITYPINTVTSEQISGNLDDCLTDQQVNKMDDDLLGIPSDHSLQLSYRQKERDDTSFLIKRHQMNPQAA